MALRRTGKQRPLEAVGYHGTRLDFADQILEEGFRPSQKPWEWLGNGVYFWQDAPARAMSWARDWHLQKGYDGPICVVAARLRLNKFVDLLDQVGMSVVREFARDFEQTMMDAKPAKVNAYPQHRLDCELFNFLTNVLSSRGWDVHGYRAAFVEGEPILTGSPIYDQSHVQLAVIDQESILEKWIINDGEER